ncbi:hypothetical protein JCM17823_27570 [Halorubrum gandharaense]
MLVLVVLSTLALGVGVGLAGTATAGDNVAIIDFDPDEVEVEPGEEVEIDVVISTDGAHGDVGVREVVLRVDYPTESLTVTRVEGNDWFHELAAEEQDLDPNEETAIDDDHGAARIEQSVTDRSGVVGEAVFATVTVEVHEDADPGVAQLSLVGTDGDPTEVVLSTDWPQPLSTAPGELVIAGGGEDVSPAWSDEAFAEPADGATEETDDDAPAPIGAAIIGVLTAMWLCSRR